MAFQALKRKLEAEGLFDAARKRPLPRFPRRIAVVTSPDGAVWHDMVTIIRRRWPAASGRRTAPTRSATRTSSPAPTC